MTLLEAAPVLCLLAAVLCTWRHNVALLAFVDALWRHDPAALGHRHPVHWHGIDLMGVVLGRSLPESAPRSLFAMRERAARWFFFLVLSVTACFGFWIVAAWMQ